MTLHAVARSLPGTLQQDVEIDGVHHVLTDEPERLGGDGDGPSPHELLPAALAACVGTQLELYARTKGWHLGSCAVHVDYDHQSTPRRFDVEVVLGAELGAEQVERLHKVAVTCPVRRALTGGAEVSERITAGRAARAA